MLKDIEIEFLVGREAKRFLGKKHLYSMRRR